ncbi:hypothetical protein [Halalkalicoccus salilacus]|uniref:hypothetical protein n=1 Tax=Halalkalicoccus TaxID=332246 RepID=UPI002F96E778
MATPTRGLPIDELELEEVGAFRIGLVLLLEIQDGIDVSAVAVKLHPQHVTS